MRKFTIILCVLAVIAAAVAVIMINRREPLVISDLRPTLPMPRQEAPGDELPAGGNAVIKTTVNLPVPFTPQAPTANWDELHNEACEEASSLMAAAYFDGVDTPTLTPEYAEKEISRLTTWEQDTYGYHLDTTMKETERMIRDVYGLQTKLISDFTENQIKQELSQGHLVIISEHGQKLGNPNYRAPGPLHHMLLIRGYASGGFVTNDSGTRRGQNYPYSFQTLYDAAGDWDHDAHTVDTSKKFALIVWNKN